MKRQKTKESCKVDGQRESKYLHPDTEMEFDDSNVIRVSKVKLERAIVERGHEHA